MFGIKRRPNKIGTYDDELEEVSLFRRQRSPHSRGWIIGDDGGAAAAAEEREGWCCNPTTTTTTSGCDQLSQNSSY
ncbi:hypothetical protein M5689_021573 [Euphorbia peplus]|nr:hypothetical protein M5689_021573 [Euphorbia peplus]